MRVLLPYFSASHRLRCTPSFDASLGRLIQPSSTPSTRRHQQGLPLQRTVPQRKVEKRDSWPLYAWSQEVEFTSAKITASELLTPQVKGVKVDLGQNVDSYTRAGQFIQVRVGETKPGFFAIASPPGDVDSQVLLLIKFLGEAASQICQLNPGDDVMVTNPMGKGFPIENLPVDKVSEILIFATGTGIGPIKALIQSSSLQIDKRASVILYYGVQNPENCLICAELDIWKNNFPTLEVRLVYSDDNKGYIQNTFEQDQSHGLQFTPSQTGIILCGHRDMCEKITNFVKEAGVPENRIVLNF